MIGKDHAANTVSAKEMAFEIVPGDVDYIEAEWLGDEGTSQVQVKSNLYRQSVRLDLDNPRWPPVQLIAYDAKKNPVPWKNGPSQPRPTVKCVITKVVADNDDPDRHPVDDFVVATSPCKNNGNGLLMNPKLGLASNKQLSCVCTVDLNFKIRIGEKDHGTQGL